MLTCRQMTERATELLEGELSFRERMAMRMHLAMCIHCRRFNRQFLALVTSLHLRQSAPPVDDAFVDRVLATMAGPSHDQPEPGG